MKYPLRSFLCGSLLAGLMGPLRADAPVLLRLKDQADRAVEPLADRGQKATVLFFLTTECPMGNRYAPEIARIAQEYQQRGVVCFAIYAAEKPDEISRHLTEYRLPLPGLQDPARRLSQRTGATVTPEACVLGPGGGLHYRGRIDDRAVKLGTMRPEAKVHDLRLALDAVLAGKPVAVKFTKAIGCYIPPPAAVK